MENTFELAGHKIETAYTKYFGDTFCVDSRYLIYQKDGCVYDTQKAQDIPQKVFALRDILLSNKKN